MRIKNKETRMNTKNWIIAALAILGCILLVRECNERRKEKEWQEKYAIGKYVYIDSDDILHVRQRCVLGLRIEDKNENTYYKSIFYCDTSWVSTDDLLEVCPFCVKDEHYEQLMEIAIRNHKHQ